MYHFLVGIDGYPKISPYWWWFSSFLLQFPVIILGDCLSVSDSMIWLGIMGMAELVHVFGSASIPQWMLQLWHPKQWSSWYNKFQDHPRMISSRPPRTCNELRGSLRKSHAEQTSLGHTNDVQGPWAYHQGWLSLTLVAVFCSLILNHEPDNEWVRCPWDAERNMLWPDFSCFPRCAWL